MSAGVPVVPANLFIADVIEATGEVFELPPLLRIPTPPPAPPVPSVP